MRLSAVTIPMIGLAALTACVKAKQKDKRTHGGQHTEVADSPSESPGEGQPISPEQPVESDPTNPTDFPRIPDNSWQVTRVHCGDGGTETLESIWTYTQAGDKATFMRKMTGGCQRQQDMKITQANGTLTLIPGAVSCDGVCTTECTPFAPAGTTVTASIATSSGGVAIKANQPLIDDFCTGRPPAEIFMTPRGARPCDYKWSTAFGNGAMQVSDGLLRWQIPAIRKLQSHELVSLSKLTGDFTVEVTYAGLETIGRGAHFKLLLRDPDDARFQAYVMAGNYSPGKGETPLHIAAVVTDGNFIAPPSASVESRTGEAGKLIISRQGTTLTARSVSDGDTSAERSNPQDKPFSSGNLQLILTLGSNSNLTDITDITSVNVEAVTVKNEAGNSLPASDAFDCQSIKQ